MSEEKWKSPSGHPISSSETDDIKMPDVVSVKELKEHLTEICKNKRIWNMPSLAVTEAVVNAIDHLRAQYPNGIKWGD